MEIASNEASAHLYVESDMEAPDLLPFSNGKVVCLCRKCPGSKDVNDDCAAVLRTDSGTTVLVVADGVGGSSMGHKASAIAVETLANYIKAADSRRDLRPAIVDAIERANHDILDLGVGAQTTLAVIEILNGSARAYQVGDSTTLIVGQRGALKWKSTAHSPVGYAIEAGLLDEKSAMHHHDRHVVSNVVGSREMRLEIGPLQPLARRDTVIVGTDGLFDNLHLNEVIENGRIGDPIERVSAMSRLATNRMLRDNSNQPGKPDDLSVLLFTP